MGLVSQHKKSAKALAFLERQPQEDIEVCSCPLLFFFLLGTLVLLPSSSDHEGKAKRTGKILVGAH